MRVLAVNAGSSTLKLRLVTAHNQIGATFDVDPWDGSAEAIGLTEWLRGLQFPISVPQLSTSAMSADSISK